MGELSGSQPTFYLCGDDSWRRSSEAGKTFFAPPGRSSPEEFAREQSRVLSVLGLQPAIDAMPLCVAVLNAHRQIVLANSALLDLLHKPSQDILGYRLGEVLGCAHWRDAPEGCGTGRYCAACGAVAAIWESQQSHGQSRHECRFTPDAPDRNALDLYVTATTIAIDGDEFVVCAVEDIADAKRLEVLSKSFFHDLLNTAGGIRGYAECVASDDLTALEEKQCIDRLHVLADILIEEISFHRDLAHAESGDLAVRWSKISTAPFLKELCGLYEGHSAAKGRKVVLDNVWDGKIESDVRLLRRILGNMIKNALEATPGGGVVAVRCEARGDRVLFQVHNDAVMPPDVQLQVFQRSFSTKGERGRGIGAYSMKLLGERYLGGEVSFSSDADSGTVFTLNLPRTRPEQPSGGKERG